MDEITSALTGRTLDEIENERTTVFQMRMSLRQRDDLDRLAGELAPASYIRRLISADAERRGFPWNDDLPDIGARGAGRRKKG